ncbi:MAG TPA: hypothetical protein VN176_16895 [Verrucomicrobiae bacterium]|nr:hypothetical protein [Verrucomicrobiae bacterium]
MNIDHILEQLENQRNRIDAAIKTLRATYGGGLKRSGRKGRRPGTRLSAEARKKISDSARARWASAKRAGKRSLKT